jgi:hypothetical protein
LQADSVPELLDRLPKAQALELHEELEEAAALAAAEALEGLTTLADFEAGALLTVERAAAPVLSPLRCQLNVLPHQLNDAESLLNLAKETVGETRHGRDPALKELFRKGEPSLWKNKKESAPEEVLEGRFRSFIRRERFGLLTVLS